MDACCQTDLIAKPAGATGTAQLADVEAEAGKHDQRELAATVRTVLADRLERPRLVEREGAALATVTEEASDCGFQVLLGVEQRRRSLHLYPPCRVDLDPI